MDHDNHPSTDNNVCVPKMDMSLHWGTCEWILVRTWKADTTGKKIMMMKRMKENRNWPITIFVQTGKFVFAAVLIALLAVAYEGLKFYRELLFYNTQKNRSKFIKQADGSVVRSEEKRSFKVDLIFPTWH